MTSEGLPKKETVIGLLEAGFNEKQIVEQLKVKATTIKRWKEEWDTKKNSQHVADLAKKNEIAKITQTNVLRDSIEILKLSPEEKIQLQANVDDLCEGLSGLSILNTTLQVAAIKMTQTVINTLNNGLSPAELREMSTVISKLNDTFFNPNNTNINILNQDGGETNVNGGGAFSQYMKD